MTRDISVPKTFDLTMMPYCVDWWNARRRESDPTLRASLSGTFFQTLPELVNLLKGHSIFISAQLSADAVSALRKVRVLNNTVEATERPSTHIMMRGVRPGE